MKYFAYGSNMDPEQMAHRCPGAVALGPARLEGHRLTFTWDSTFWRGGVGDVVATLGDEVWGVLWEISDENERALDRYEGIDKDVYRRATVTVEHEGGTVEALIYVATATDYKAPSKRYMRALVRGARAHGLPADYVAQLEGIAQG